MEKSPVAPRPGDVVGRGGCVLAGGTLSCKNRKCKMNQDGKCKIASKVSIDEDGLCEWHKENWE
jgi:hypothetical protein